MTDRQLLRRDMRRVRASLGDAFRQEASDEIMRRVLSLPEYAQAKRIFCYYSLAGEVRTVGLLREMLASGKEVYLPVTGPDKALTAVRLTAMDAVHEGAFHVPEPDGEEAAEPESIDLVLAPGLAFDLNGGRMGYGAGCYDRFLPRCRCPVAALAFEAQLIECVPMEPHDQRMHLIVTEKRVSRCVPAGTQAAKE